MNDKIITKHNLRRWLEKDSANYHTVIGLRGVFHQLFVSPISDQWYIWKYIKNIAIL